MSVDLRHNLDLPLLLPLPEIQALTTAKLKSEQGGFVSTGFVLVASAANLSRCQHQAR